MKLPIKSRPLRIEGSCNGLVLVYSPGDLRYMYEDTFYVLNPTIKEYVEFSRVCYTERFNLYGFGYVVMIL